MADEILTLACLDANGVTQLLETGDQKHVAVGKLNGLCNCNSSADSQWLGVVSADKIKHLFHYLLLQ